MKNPTLNATHNFRRLYVSRTCESGLKVCSGIVLVSTLLLAGCASAPKKPEGADALRNKLSQLQADANLASLAPVALREAEEAVELAELPTKDKELADHRLWMADSRVEIARASAQSRYNEDQRNALSENRETARLDSRTQEADKARLKNDDLEKQIAELNARPTDRGLVMTLGDVLFATGKAELMGGSASNLDKLADFLEQYPERTAEIEGHTDNVGSADLNRGLSQRRADSVKNYLVQQGVESSRLSTTGKGFDSPVAGNDSAAGRQQNRRVEIIISESNATSSL
jgi:outer membrane protein OmpA-like peptidoglycan-associated protein